LRLTCVHSLTLLFFLAIRVGALKQWVDNQHKYDNYFCVVDLHAITNMHDKTRLRQETLEAAAMYIAAGMYIYMSCHVMSAPCMLLSALHLSSHYYLSTPPLRVGIDPKESCIFVQSHIPAHAELAWLLNCVTPMSWLERMIQYKEKSNNSKQKGNEDAISVGLFDYPVLMAADILLYQAELVPVGEDQRQHLELARDICRRFNDQYPHCHPSSPIHTDTPTATDTYTDIDTDIDTDACTTSISKKKKQNQKQTCSVKSPFLVFREPASLVMTEGARLMSLQDGSSKMSKSHEGDNTRINLLDPPDLILKKIKRCKTDSMGGDLTFCNPDRPECINLLNIYQSVSSGKTRASIESEVQGMQWGSFKPLLAESIIEHLAPIQKEYGLIMKDEVYIEHVLAEGRIKAATTAKDTLKQAKQAMGFYTPPPHL
jgi:tryptophanyl-tRNA synthetase